MLRSDVNGVEVTTRERSLPVALFRRLVGFIPGRDLGLNRRRRCFKWRDVYEMDFSADTDRLLDRRLALASAVGMDALMAR